MSEPSRALNVRTTEQVGTSNEPKKSPDYSKDLGERKESDGKGSPNDGQITYSLYLTYLEEIEHLQLQHKEATHLQEKIEEELLLANGKLNELDRCLLHRKVGSIDVNKQIYEDTDAMDFKENAFQEELRGLRAENEEVTLLKHRVTSRIFDAKTEAEGLKTMTHNIESKLLEVQEELDKIKAAKIAYEESTFQEKEQMKNQVQNLAEKNKELSKAVDSITSEIAAKSKTQKQLEVTLQKTKDELRSLAKQFSKKQEKEEAKANDRKATLYEGVIAGGAPTGEVTLVFSSVDGSKELWEMFPTAMTLAIDMHNNILKNRIKSVGGYEVKSDGDSFMVAFGDVLSGLQYCMLVQEDLLGATWPQEILSSQYAAEKQSADGRLLFCGLRCRMGLHMGKPQCRPNPVTGRMDYLGSMVNKSARVAGLAHGGQVFASDAAVKHLFDIKDENCRVYLSQLGIRYVGTFPLRGIQGEERITEILPHTLRDRQFAGVGADVLPQSPTAALAKDAANTSTEVSEVSAEVAENPGAQFAKFAEIHEPLLHQAPGQQIKSHSRPRPPPLQSTAQQLTVSIPSPSETPAASPSGIVVESMAAMESLTNSLLNSFSTAAISNITMGTTSVGAPAAEGSAIIGRNPFSPSPAGSHPDDEIQKKHEDKLKAAEEYLIKLKGDLARVKTEKDDLREHLKALKEKEKSLKFKYTQEGKLAQEKQQDLTFMVFEKLHTNQLLEQANSNIKNIQSLLRTVEQKIAQTTASRDHAKNAYQHWDKMMKMCSQEVLVYAKKSTQLESDWASLRNGKAAYFNVTKVLESKIEQSTSTAPQASTSNDAQTPQDALLYIEHIMKSREVETDLPMLELFYRDKIHDNEILKGYVLQLISAVADDSAASKPLVATKELGEKVVQQEQQLQKIAIEKQKLLQEVQDLQKALVQEVSQQLKMIKHAQGDLATEAQKSKEIKARFSGIVAEKYQEVVSHLQQLEKTQKAAPSGKPRRHSIISLVPGSPQGDKVIDRRMLSSSERVGMHDREKGGFTPLEKGKPGGYHSSYSLLESSAMNKDSQEKLRLSSSVKGASTEKDTLKTRLSATTSFVNDKKKATRDRKQIQLDSVPEIRSAGGSEGSTEGKPITTGVNSEISGSKGGSVGTTGVAVSAGPGDSVKGDIIADTVVPIVSDNGADNVAVSAAGASSGGRSIPNVRSSIRSSGGSTAPGGVVGTSTNNLKSSVRSSNVGNSIGSVTGNSISSSGSAAGTSENGNNNASGAASNGTNNESQPKQGYDFRSIALVQNELALRLAERSNFASLDNTRDQMATLSRFVKGTKLDEDDLSIGGTSVDGYSLAADVDDKLQQRISMSLLRLAMQIRPEAYHRHRRLNNALRSEDLKVAGQKLY